MCRLTYKNSSHKGVLFSTSTSISVGNVIVGTSGTSSITGVSTFSSNQPVSQNTRKITTITAGIPSDNFPNNSIMYYTPQNIYNSLDV